MTKPAGTSDRGDIASICRLFAATTAVLLVAAITPLVLEHLTGFYLWTGAIAAAILSVAARLAPATRNGRRAS